MMKSFKTAIAAFFAGLLILVTPSAIAGDPIIDAAKAEGLVGERIDGYLGLVSDVDPSIKRKVDEVNAGRRSVYSDLASQQGQSLEDVARVSGMKLIERAPSGYYVYDDSNRWVIKP